MARASRATRTSKVALRWGALALCVGLFVYALAKTDLAAGFTRIREIGPLVTVALLPFPLALVFDAFGWRRLFRALGHRVSVGVLFRVRLTTEAVASSTPGGAIWAEALAPILITQLAGVPTSKAIAASTAKRWLVIRAHAAYVACAVLFGFPALSHASRRLVGSDLLLLIILAGSVLLLALAHAIESLTARGRFGGRISAALGSVRFLRLASWLATRQHHFNDTDAAIATLSDDRRATRFTFAMLLGLWFIDGFETFLILRLLGADLGFAAVMSFDAALSVVRSAAIFAPAGIGVQDLGYLAALDAYGVPSASGIGPAFIVIKRLKEAFWCAVGFALLIAARRRGVRPHAVPPREVQSPAQ